VELGAKIEELEERDAKFGGEHGYIRRDAANRVRDRLYLHSVNLGNYVATDSKVCGALKVAQENARNLEIEVECLHA
jgi:hypothetical protein